MKRGIWPRKCHYWTHFILFCPLHSSPRTIAIFARETSLPQAHTVTKLHWKAKAPLTRFLIQLPSLQYLSIFVKSRREQVREGFFQGKSSHHQSFQNLTFLSFSTEKWVLLFMPSHSFPMAFPTPLLHNLPSHLSSTTRLPHLQTSLLWFVSTKTHFQ